MFLVLDKRIWWARYLKPSENTEIKNLVISRRWKIQRLLLSRKVTFLMLDPAFLTFREAPYGNADNLMRSDHPTQPRWLGSLPPEWASRLANICKCPDLNQRSAWRTRSSKVRWDSNLREPWNITLTKRRTNNRACLVPAQTTTSSCSKPASRSSIPTSFLPIDRIVCKSLTAEMSLDLCSRLRWWLLTGWGRRASTRCFISPKRVCRWAFPIHKA